MSYNFSNNQVISFWHVHSRKRYHTNCVLINFRYTNTSRNNPISILIDILFWSEWTSYYCIPRNYIFSFYGFHHFATSIEAEPFVTDPSLSITFALAAAGISSITLRAPLDCHSSFFKVPADFKTEYDC